MLPHNITQYQGCTCKSFYLNSMLYRQSRRRWTGIRLASASGLLCLSTSSNGGGARERHAQYSCARESAQAHTQRWCIFSTRLASTQTQTRHQLSEDLQTSTGTQPPLLLQFLIYLHSESRWRCEGDSCWCCYQKLQWSSWLVCLPLH